jgi:hypothetical protein
MSKSPTRRHLRGQGSLVRSQFTGKLRRKRTRQRAINPDKEFRRGAIALAKKRLQNAIEWLDRDDVGWALNQTQSATNLLQSVIGL